MPSSPAYINLADSLGFNKNKHRMTLNSYRLCSTTKVSIQQFSGDKLEKQLNCGITLKLHVTNKPLEQKILEGELLIATSTSPLRSAQIGPPWPQ